MKKINYISPIYDPKFPLAKPEIKGLYDIFDRVVLINLDQRKDRLDNAMKELAKGWPFLEPFRFSAIHGDKVGVPRTWTEGGNTFGCMESHRQILERAIQDDVQSLLVLEDDLVLVDDFVNKAQRFFDSVPGDWDQLMLGGQHIAPTTTLCDGVVKCFNTQRTHAYAIRGKFMRDLFIHWISTQGHCDHRMGELQGKYKVYAPKPFLFGQNEGRSDINGRQHPIKFWEAPAYENHLVILLHCPKEILPELRKHGFHTGFTRDGNTDIDVGLRDMFPDYTTKALADWQDMIIWECESMLLAGKKAYCTIWHPQITYDMTKQASQCKVLEITASSVEEALQQFSKYGQSGV